MSRQTMQQAVPGYSIESGEAMLGSRWVCVRHLESQCGQDFYDDRDPFMFAFLSKLAALSAPAQPGQGAEPNIPGLAADPSALAEAFDAHMGAACWTDPSYQPDAAMWAAAWRAALAAHPQPAQGLETIMNTVRRHGSDKTNAEILAETGAGQPAQGEAVAPKETLTFGPHVGEVNRDGSVTWINANPLRMPVGTRLYTHPAAGMAPAAHDHALEVREYQREAHELRVRVKELEAAAGMAGQGLVPLSEQQVAAAWCDLRAKAFTETRASERRAFKRGVEFAERHHGIHPASNKPAGSEAP